MKGSRRTASPANPVLLQLDNLCVCLCITRVVKKKTLFLLPALLQLKAAGEVMQEAAVIAAGVGTGAGASSALLPRVHRVLGKGGCTELV